MAARKWAALHMRKSLKFPKAILRTVDETKRDIAEEMGLPVETVTFVGMHNRKTDSEEAFIAMKFHSEPLPIQYFHDAMDYFRYI